MNENRKMRHVEIIPEIEGGGDKGEWWRVWIQLWYIIRTFVNVTVYLQYNNNIIKNRKKKKVEFYSAIKKN
jgi:hypothetical protein